MRALGPGAVDRDKSGLATKHGNGTRRYLPTYRAQVPSKIAAVTRDAAVTSCLIGVYLTRPMEGQYWIDA